MIPDYDNHYDHNQHEARYKYDDEIRKGYDEPGETAGDLNICNICGHKFTDEEMKSVFYTEYGEGGPMCEDRVSPCCMNYDFKDVEDES